ncbi:MULTISPECIES: hypothetical protein [Acidithiobacillus]|jgi:methyl-accepting chemotaxis protein|uniref:Uncharacterized protein n=1 Tax=Acidithiobacillus ferridurans TaxID=1232575 RepID=A0A2Z6IIN4_ACIFI|nr:MULTISPECIES: hypothetical protein [Acidithiobacillus]MBU2851020.1 hypothetical protein [Acidithiobacillus ferrivorans]MCR2831567.1 hypothetical protein [Acidithiobacillus ferrooxidans]OFA15246.1 hypothetical protein A4U49_14545 [Acidithiobacillus ferrivorans]BBF63875.1 hypothetical protein AFERRID_00930 [Acidithiobacillus ferridurans]
MESEAKTVEPKDHVSGDNLEKLSHRMTRVTEEAELTLAETTKAVVSLTAVMELIRSQAANVEKMAEEVSELAGMAQKRAESARTFSMLATISSTICTGLAVILLVLLIQVKG